MSTNRKTTTTARRSASPASAGRARAQQQTRARTGGRKSTGRRPISRNQPKPAPRRQPATQGSLQAGRYLWAVVTAVVIAALLFEPTWSWMVGVGLFFLASGEFTGLWMLVSGYVMTCAPAAFGLLIATGRFWTSLTHALWIGALYLVIGFILLDRILGLLGGGL